MEWEDKLGLSRERGRVRDSRLSSDVVGCTKDQITLPSGARLWLEDSGRISPEPSENDLPDPCRHPCSQPRRKEPVETRYIPRGCPMLGGGDPTNGYGDFT